MRFPLVVVICGLLSGSVNASSPWIFYCPDLLVYGVFEKGEVHIKDRSGDRNLKGVLCFDDGDVCLAFKLDNTGSWIGSTSPENLNSSQVVIVFEETANTKCNYSLMTFENFN
jgi:hypothetical protein